MKKVKKVVEIDAIDFGNNRIFEVKMLRDFINLANEGFIETIDCTDSYTPDYFYFNTDKEKELAKVLLEKNVIRLSPYYDYNNDRVGKIKNYETYYYWLDKGFEKFENDFNDIIFSEK